jgi:adenosylmethionine-8-amino-7-oxononanoate aminotransferase
VLEQLASKIDLLAGLLTELSGRPHVAEVRQCGFIVGIELKRQGREPYPPEELIGAKVCLAARVHGLLTRPIRDTIVLMPPYCISEAQLRAAVAAVEAAIGEVCGG